MTTRSCLGFFLIITALFGIMRSPTFASEKNQTVQGQAAYPYYMPQGYGLRPIGDSNGATFSVAGCHTESYGGDANDCPRSQRRQ